MLTNCVTPIREPWNQRAEVGRMYDAEDSVLRIEFDDGREMTEADFYCAFPFRVKVTDWVERHGVRCIKRAEVCEINCTDPALIVERLRGGSLMIWMNVGAKLWSLIASGREDVASFLVQDLIVQAKRWMHDPEKIPYVAPWNDPACSKQSGGEVAGGGASAQSGGAK